MDEQLSRCKFLLCNERPNTINIERRSTGVWEIKRFRKNVTNHFIVLCVDKHTGENANWFQKDADDTALQYLIHTFLSFAMASSGM